MTQTWPIHDPATKPTKANQSRPKPTKDNHCQPKQTKANQSPKPTRAHQSPSKPTKVNKKSPPKPTKADQSRPEPTKANHCQPKPTTVYGCIDAFIWSFSQYNIGRRSTILCPILHPRRIFVCFHLYVHFRGALCTNSGFKLAIFCSSSRWLAFLIVCIDR